MTGSARTRGFDGPPAEVNATTIRTPRGGSDGSRTYLLRQPHDSNNEVGRRVARGTRRCAHPRPGENRLANGCRDPGDSSHADNGDDIRGERVPTHSGQTRPSCSGCAPQKVDPALIARFRPAMFGCFVPPASPVGANAPFGNQDSRPRPKMRLVPHLLRVSRTAHFG